MGLSDKNFGSKVSSLGPRVHVKINDNTLLANAVDFIGNVKVEQARDKAGLISMTIYNPLLTIKGQQRTSELPFTDHKAFAPGNTVEIFFSYDDEEPVFCQAGIIQKTNPNFPRTGTPTLTLKAFDALVWLMDGNEKMPNTTAARRFGSDLTLAQIAAQILGEYGFDLANVDLSTKTPVPTVSSHKAAGKSDYDLIQGIASTLGWEFFTDFNPKTRKWMAFFRPPKTEIAGKKRFTWGPDFQGNGEVGGVLLDFDPQFSIRGASTSVEVYYYDEGSRTWEAIVWPKPKGKEKKKELSWKGDETSFANDLKAAGAADGARGLRIQAGGESVEVVPKKGFRNSEEAVAFAESWWRARQDLLITGTGSVMGYPKLKPNQVHDLQGLGAGYSGDWYFSEVTHVYTAGGGSSVYENQFLGRKVIP
jgi:phage protein D